jgi:hypothetical protein
MVVILTDSLPVVIYQWRNRDPDSYSHTHRFKNIWAVILPPKSSVMALILTDSRIPWPSAGHLKWPSFSQFISYITVMEKGHGPSALIRTDSRLSWPSLGHLKNTLSAILNYSRISWLSCLQSQNLLAKSFCARNREPVRWPSFSQIQAFLAVK